MEAGGHGLENEDSTMDPSLGLASLKRTLLSGIMRMRRKNLDKSGGSSLLFIIFCIMMPDYKRMHFEIQGKALPSVCWGRML